jgi:hypothetical protein
MAFAADHLVRDISHRRFLVLKEGKHRPGRRLSVCTEGPSWRLSRRAFCCLQNGFHLGGHAVPGRIKRFKFPGDIGQLLV